MDKSMTGDGEWRAEGRWPTVWCDGKSLSCFELTEEHNALVAHALAQAAEIERLTRESADRLALYLQYVEKAQGLEWNLQHERDRVTALTQTVEAKAALVIEACQLASQLRHRAEASEARTADLLKALEEYGGHHGGCAWYSKTVEEMLAGGVRRECDCGLDTAIAAAKGETV